MALSTAGLAVLSLRGAEVSSGVLLILASAVLYALHILGLGLWSSASDALGLAAVQMRRASPTVCTIGAAPGGITLPPDGRAWLATLYTALRRRSAGDVPADLGPGPPDRRPGPRSS